MRQLRSLVRVLPAYRWLGPARDVAITAIVDHTQHVVPGCLFACLPGTRTDGHAFAAEAVSRGAVALLVRQPLPGLAAVQIQVPDVPRALAVLAREWYGRPDDALHLLGVTGTNGKTTTTYFLRAGLEAAGLPCGLVGTVAYWVGQGSEPARLTTPGALDFYRLLRCMVEAGLRAAAVEASSHALAQHRVSGHVFDAAIFTNLDRDHLDYHGTPEQYLRAKAMLFTPRSVPKPWPAIAVLPADDATGLRLARWAEGARELVTYAVEAPADVVASDVQTSPSESTFGITGRYGRGRLSIRLPGMHNVRNALAALAALVGSGIPLGVAAEGIAALEGIPGRCERIDVGQPFDAFVDFAHNPHGLRATLSALRPKQGRLIAVLGCKGEDGDWEKRRLMGETAGAWADVVVVTTDDPYSEEPEAIAAQVASGAREAGHAPVHVILDRREAIRAAVRMARPGDAVVICGRGHEPFQPVAGRLLPLDDRQVCLEALREWTAQQRVAAISGRSAKELG